MASTGGKYHKRNTDRTSTACVNKTERQKHILEECPALMDQQIEEITATDIFETKISKLKFTRKKIIQNISIFNIITQQQKPLFKHKIKNKGNQLGRPAGRLDIQEQCNQK